MSERSEAIFQSLRGAEAIGGLLGKAEDGDMDFKQWLSPEANRGSLAKAACAFANATGGVIVIGVVASGGRGDDPDVATGLDPVMSAEGVKATVQDIIQKQVDPGIEGVEVIAVPEMDGSKSGFVVVHVPDSASPQRSRIDRHFYARNGAASIPMAMYQIADRFGRRPQPRLQTGIQDVVRGAAIGFSSGVHRAYKLVVTNEGRGIARYPAVFFESNLPINLQPFHTPIWTFSQGPKPSFRGGANEVIYPGETKVVAHLYQAGRLEGSIPIYAELRFRTWVVCFDSPQVEQTLVLPAHN